jgi:hypothetical protein
MAPHTDAPVLLLVLAGVLVLLVLIWMVAFQRCDGVRCRCEGPQGTCCARTERRRQHPPRRAPPLEASANEVAVEREERPSVTRRAVPLPAFRLPPATVSEARPLGLPLLELEDEPGPNRPLLAGLTPPPSPPRDLITGLAGAQQAGHAAATSEAAVPV